MMLVNVRTTKLHRSFASRKAMIDRRQASRAAVQSQSLRITGSSLHLRGLCSRMLAILFDRQWCEMDSKQAAKDVAHQNHSTGRLVRRISDTEGTHLDIAFPDVHKEQPDPFFVAYIMQEYKFD